MNNHMKIVFNDNMLKIKIPNKIKVSSLFDFLKKALNIQTDSKLILINNTRRFSENDEICHKDLKNLNKEEFVLLEVKDYRNLSKPKQKTLQEKQDTQTNINDKITKNKKSQAKIKNSLQEKIKKCTNARTLINPYKVVKTKSNSGEGNFLNHFYERFDEEYDSSYEEDYFNDEDDEYYYDEYDSLSENTFDSVSIREFSNRIGYIPNNNNNLPFQIQRVYPHSGSNTLSRVVNNSSNLGSNHFVNALNRNNSNNYIFDTGNFNSSLHVDYPFHLRIFDNSNRNRQILNYNEEMLNILQDMGFNLERSRIALRLTRNNIEEATHLLINAPDVIFDENIDLGGSNNAVILPQNNYQNINNNDAVNFPILNSFHRYNNSILNFSQQQMNNIININNNTINNTSENIRNNDINNNNLLNRNRFQQGISSEIDRIRYTTNDLRESLNNLNGHVIDNQLAINQNSDSNIPNLTDDLNNLDHNQNVRINVIGAEGQNLNENDYNEIAGNNFQVIRLDNNDEQSLTHTENQIFSRNESEEDN